MIGFIKKLFGVTPAVEAAPVADTRVEAANSAPYKVPAPAETTPVPPAADKAVEALVRSIEPAKKPAPKKQQPAKKAPAAKKPAATKAPAKKPAPKKSKPAV